MIFLHSKKGNSGAEAVHRLENTLIYEKTDIDSFTVDIIKNEVKNVLKKHLTIDENRLCVIIKMRGRENCAGNEAFLEISVPIDRQ